MDGCCGVDVLFCVVCCEGAFVMMVGMDWLVVWCVVLFQVFLFVVTVFVLVLLFDK